MIRSILTAALLGTLVIAAPEPGFAAQNSLATDIITKHDIDDVSLFDGVVEAINRSTISAQTSGRVTEINFDVDDQVPSGAIIMRFDDGEHKARLLQSENSLKAAEAIRTGAKDVLDRVEKLHQRGTVAKARLDDAKASYETANARSGAARAAVEQAKEQLAYTIIKAPYEGIVVGRHVQVGELASPGQPLMTGFSLEELRVKVAVPQQFANLIRRENNAVIHDDDGGTITAEKLTIFPYADAKSNTVTIRAILPTGSRNIFPGMLLKVAFKTGIQSSLFVSDKSTVKRGEVRGVYLMHENGSLYLQQIRTGRLIDGQVEVLSGLKQGDRIVRNPLEAVISIKSMTDDAQ
ncbi:MAG: efflux RND transporter periplasmic adaptor subunit [Gammaproteobacteria bacterium]|nr:efflux RND transporter periplasmic adaptor subunit [Gammaproteobacteria bacterium]